MKRAFQRFLFIEVVLVVLIIMVCYAIAPPFNGSFDNFSKLTGVLLGVFTLLNATIVAIWSHLYRAEIDKEIGEDKERRAAYETLSKVAAFYYHELRMLELGQWDEEKADQAETRMKEADGLTTHLNETQKTFWYNFFQDGLNLADAVNIRAHDAQARIGLWQERAGEFGNKLEKVRDLRKFE